MKTQVKAATAAPKPCPERVEAYRNYIDGIICLSRYKQILARLAQ